MAAIPREVVANLYAAFSSEPKPTTIPTHPHGFDRDERDVLLSKPRSDLDRYDLRPYVDDLAASCEPRPDLSFFLPRILELLPDTGLDLWCEKIGSVLANFAWMTLSPDQQSAIQRFFDAVIVEVSDRRHVSGVDLDSLLCGTSYFLPKWEDLLTRVESRPAALVALTRWNAKAVRDGFESLSSWEGSPKKEAFLQWLRSDVVQVRAWSK